MRGADPFANDRRVEMEARITALLLGEYEGSVAADLEDAIAADPNLRALRDHLQSAIGLLDVVSKPAAELPLDEDKREAILARFKEPVPELATPTEESRSARNATVNPARTRLQEWARPLGLAACLGGLLFVGAISLHSPAKSSRISRMGFLVETAPTSAAVTEKSSDESSHWAWHGGAEPPVNEPHYAGTRLIAVAELNDRDGATPVAKARPQGLFLPASAAKPPTQNANISPKSGADRDDVVAANDTVRSTIAASEIFGNASRDPAPGSVALGLSEAQPGVFFDTDGGQIEELKSGLVGKSFAMDAEGRAAADLDLFARNSNREAFGLNPDDGLQAANETGKTRSWGVQRNLGRAAGDDRTLNDLALIQDKQASIQVYRINGSDGAVTVEFDGFAGGEMAGKEVDARFGAVEPKPEPRPAYAKFDDELSTVPNEKSPTPQIVAASALPLNGREKELREQGPASVDTGGHATFLNGIIASGDSGHPAVAGDDLAAVRGLASQPQIAAMDLDDPGPFVPQAQAVPPQPAQGVNPPQAMGNPALLGDLPLMGRLFRSGSQIGIGGGGGGQVAQASPPAGSPGVPARSFDNGGGTPPEPAAGTAALQYTDDVAALIQDGKTLYEMRLLDESKKKLNEAVAKDPNAKAAHYYLSLVQEEEYGEEARKRDAMQKDRLASVNDAWKKGRSLKSKALPEPNPYFRTNTVVTTTRDTRPHPFPSQPRAKPNPIVVTKQNAFSTFSLNVSDVSFKLAAASLEQGKLPDPGSVRSEEFVNAFDYRDPAPTGDEKLAFAWERARDPFAHNRDLIRFSVQTAAAGREPGRALNLVVLLDNSGSMERVDRVMIVRQALRVLSQQLTDADTISVVAFARTPRLVVDGLAGNRTDELLERILHLYPQGGTNLEAAMDLAYEIAQKRFSERGNNRVILLTDGAANLGNVDPVALKQKVETFRGKGVALDAFGIGWDGYNDALLETLSRNGDGRYGFLNQPETVNAEFADQLAGALRVAAKNVKAQIEFNPARVVSWRQIGYEKHQLKKEQFRDNRVDAAEIGAAEAGTALYSIQVDPQGSGPLGVARIRFLNPATGVYEEKAWPLAYEKQVPSLEQAAPSLRLAAGAALFAEWLAQSPYAAEVSPEALAGMLGDAAERLAPDARPARLADMIRQARLIGAP